jgi:hypothetical protein
VTILRRRFHLDSLAIVSVSAAALALVFPRSAHARCTTDAQCKGVRICENGRCVNPPAEVGTASPSRAAPPGTATPSDATSEGHPQSPAPPAGTPVPAAIVPAEQATALESKTSLETAGPAQRPPPPVGSATASPAAVQFTELQRAALMNAGARLDAKDMEMADRLGRKGFVGDDFVAAYREYGVLKSKHPELAPLGRDVVETVAVAQKLGLSQEDQYRFVWDHHQRNQTVTQASYASLPTGRGLVMLGAVTTAAGIGLLAGGMRLATDVTYDDRRGNVTSGWGYGGKAMEIVGGASIVAGLSIAIIGLYRWTTPLTDVPDSPSPPKSQSLRPAVSARRESAIRWALSPSLGPKYTGFGLGAAF